MFLRRKHITVSGRSYDYYAVVQNVREGGRVRQKTVVHLGKLDLRDSKRVLEWLKGLALLAPGVMVVEPGDVIPDGSVVFAPLVAARAAWEFWGLGDVIGQVCGDDAARLAFVMAANRLTDPGSKLYVSQWYPRTALPQLLGVGPEEVYDERLYRAMDRLVDAQAAVEGAVASRLGEVGQDLKVVLYDMTSTYFCGRESELVRYGYSRDHRNDRPQITVGVVTTLDGFPVAHRVYPGNTVDVSTVFQLAREVKERFGARGAIFVGDRGMMSGDNVRKLLRLKCRYILCLRQPRIPRLREEFWSGLSAQSGQELVVTDLRRGRGRFVAGYNPEKAERDRQVREDLIARGRAGLEKLAAAAAKGRYRTKANLLKRATKLLVLLGADRYFRYDVSPRGRPRLRFSVNQEEVARAARKDGLFVLRTNVLDLPAEQIVAAYKSLGRVEQAFRTLKSFVRIRPIYHRKDLRIKAHVFICLLAYLLQRTLEHRLHGKGIRRTWPDVLTTLETLRWSWIEVGTRRIGRPDRPRAEQLAILQALGIAGDFARLEVDQRA